MFIEVNGIQINTTHVSTITPTSHPGSYSVRVGDQTFVGPVEDIDSLNDTIIPVQGDYYLLTVDADEICKEKIVAWRVGQNVTLPITASGSPKLGHFSDGDMGVYCEADGSVAIPGGAFFESLDSFLGTAACPCPCCQAEEALF